MIVKSRHVAKKFTDYVHAQHMHSKTRERKLRIMRKYIAFLEEHYPNDSVMTVGNEAVFAFLSSWRELKSRTYNLYIGELRYFFRWLEKHLHARPFSLLLEPKRTEETLPKNIPLQDMITLCSPGKEITAQTNSPSARLLDLRNQAIIEFLFSTGVRSQEIRQIRIKHFSHDLQECSIITIKGGHNRIVYLGKPAREALLAYFSARRVDLKRHADAYAFPNRKQQMMSGKHLVSIIKNLAIRRIGYPVTPHRIRHTFATAILRNAHCIRSLQAMLGHHSISNTARYCHLDFADQMQALGEYHPHGDGTTSDNQDH